MRGGSAIAAAIAVSMSYSTASSEEQKTQQALHARSTFSFFLAAPMAKAAPFFGPEGERCWAGAHWDPHFIYPQPAKDIEGAVFTVEHGSGRSVWVNTVFDLAAGRMQYVSFIPTTMVSMVDVHLAAAGQASTKVEVTYTRTALSAASNNDVRRLSAETQDNGSRWQRAIEECLAFSH